MSVEVIGVYPINSNVHLFEVMLNDNKPSEVNVDEFTQEILNEPKENWQAAYDERYLNESGDRVVGDFFEKPLEDIAPTRLAFFMYYVNFNTPLITPYGEVALPFPSPLPQRLKDIIVFDEVD